MKASASTWSRFPSRAWKGLRATLAGRRRRWVDHADPHPGRLDGRVAAARVRLRVVGRAHDALLGVEEAVGLAVAVGVVAERDHLRTGLEDVAPGARRDPDPRRPSSRR